MSEPARDEREAMEQALKLVETLYERGKRDIFSMDEQQFAEYRREVAQAIQGRRPLSEEGHDG